MRERGKLGKQKTKQTNKKNKTTTWEWTSQRKIHWYNAYVYIHTHGHLNIYINSDTHIHINTLFVTQVR